jgi:hypothetical protein
MDLSTGGGGVLVDLIGIGSTKSVPNIFAK